MQKARFATFDEFQAYYARQHQDSRNRTLHVAGTIAALAVAGVALARRRPAWLLLAPIVGYAPAWAGHLLLERNRPATFGHPLWSLRADLNLLIEEVGRRMRPRPKPRAGAARTRRLDADWSARRLDIEPKPATRR